MKKGLNSNADKIICLFAAILMGIAGVVIAINDRPAAAATENCGCHPHKAVLKFTHKPVKNGECESCHKPSGERHPKVKKGSFLLTDNGKSGLCNECHERKDTMKFLHKPVATGDCGDCHDFHQSNYRYMLKGHGADLCFMCHEKGKFDRRYPHAPITEGRCLGCHDPHQADVKYLLKGDGMNLCVLCHNKALFEGKSVHKPVADGECSACHTTHGTQFPHLLKRSFPEDFYLPFDKGGYALCFGCHSNVLADDQLTDKQTNFRNGMYSMHYVHVNKDYKGRSCKVCHDPHASSQLRLISTKVAGFGRWRIPIRFTKTATGGTCVVGCHKPKSYDRIDPVDNP